MTSDLRRRWQAVFVTLLIWGCANLIGAAVQAAEGDPAPAGDVEAQAITERLDAMVQRAAATLRGRQGGEGELIEPGANAATLRERLEEAETEIRLLKNVVIQALRAQSTAEEALLREQAARQSGGVPEAEPATAGAQDMILAQRVEALTDSVRQLRADVAEALRSGSPRGQPPEPDRQSALRPSDSIDDSDATGDALEEDAMLPEAGIGGRYEPWIEDEPSQSGGDAHAAVPSADAPTAAGDPIKIAEVHFDTGSAQLTPGGERRTLDAVEQIRSMAPVKVRVVAFTDRVGDSAYNLVLSKERALSVAAVLENAGFSRNLVEVVGNGEHGIPVPTSDGVPEPLNRSAGIYVVRDATG